MFKGYIFTADEWHGFSKRVSLALIDLISSRHIIKPLVDSITKIPEWIVGSVEIHMELPDTIGGYYVIHERKMNARIQNLASALYKDFESALEITCKAKNEQAVWSTNKPWLEGLMSMAFSSALAAIETLPPGADFS